MIVKEKCLLSLAYWGNIQYFTKFLLYKNINIEQYETYPKQSYRNRCKILAANGVQTLNVPIIKGSSRNITVKDIQIAYDTKWEKNHLKTIEAAYGSAPFFEFFMDDFIPIYEKKYKFLLDLDIATLQVAFEWLNIDSNYQFSDDFIFQPTCDDYRNSIHPKDGKNEKDNYFLAYSYYQKIDTKHTFVPNLSIIDLIVNTGTEARIILLKSIKK